jgi:HAD superfamily hydrolase (TIGR01456 family)
MKSLVQKYENDLVLAVGKGDAPRHIAESYGFRNVVSVDQFHGHCPDIYPDFESTSKERNELWNAHIKAVLCFNDPLYWGRELQMLCDIARSDGIPGNTVPNQSVSFYFSGADFEYATSFRLPRFGSGAFIFSLEKLYHRLTDRHLEKTLFGKPQTSSYRYVEQALESQAAQNGHEINRIYAIGDNPLSDIKGANAAGGKWRSILVRTGVWTGNSEEIRSDHPHFICDDVEHALESILEHESQ